MLYTPCLFQLHSVVEFRPTCVPFQQTSHLSVSKKCFKMTELSISSDPRRSTNGPLDTTWLQDKSRLLF